MQDSLDHDVHMRTTFSCTFSKPDPEDDHQQPLIPPAPSVAATRTINVRFCYLKILRRYVSTEFGYTLIEENCSASDTLDIKFSFTAFLLIDEETGIRRELELLAGWGIPVDSRIRIASKVCIELRKLVLSITSSRSSEVSFLIKVGITAMMCEEIDYEDATRYLEDLRNAEMESMEVDAKPVPASKLSVDALERVVLGSLENSRECTICKETIELGILAIRMPCSHLYHQDCIVRWLQNSHFCPLCRYEMPVENA